MQCFEKGILKVGNPLTEKKLNFEIPKHTLLLNLA